MSTTIQSAHTIQAPLPDAPANFFAGAAFAYGLDAVIRSTVANQGAPVEACRVTLQLSPDGGKTYSDARTVAAGIAAWATSYQSFVLADFATSGAWTHWRIVWGGNIGAAVVISAVGDSAALSGGGGGDSVFGAAGPAHSTGLAPDPGATSHATPYLLGDDAAWHQVGGPGLSYSDGAFTIAGGSPGGSDTQLQYNDAGALAGAANLTVGSAGQLNFGTISAPGSPANGDAWHDATQHASAYRQSGQTIFRPGLVYSQVANVTATAAASTSLVSTAGAIGSTTFAAGFLSVVGRVLRVRAKGYLSTAGTAGNATLVVYLGTGVVATTQGTNWNNNISNCSWVLDLDITTKAAGASGLIDCFGMWTFNTVGGAGNFLSVTNGTSAGSRNPASQVPIDLTQSFAIDVQIVMTVTGNSFTAPILTVEVL